jgi:hypothetical protein
MIKLTPAERRRKTLELLESTPRAFRKDRLQLLEIKDKIEELRDELPKRESSEKFPFTF